jgi:hypothetical protein
LNHKACADSGFRAFKGSAQLDSEQVGGVSLSPYILQGLNDRKSFSEVTAFEVRQLLQMQVVVRLKAALHAKGLVGDAQTGHERQGVP